MRLYVVVFPTSFLPRPLRLETIIHKHKHIDATWYISWMRRFFDKSITWCESEKHRQSHLVVFSINGRSRIRHGAGPQVWPMACRGVQDANQETPAYVGQRLRTLLNFQGWLLGTEWNWFGLFYLLYEKGSSTKSNLSVGEGKWRDNGKWRVAPARCRAGTCRRFQILGFISFAHG